VELIEAIQARHSVRSYLDKAIEPEKAAVLQQAIDEYNEQSGLSIQLCLDDPLAFGGFMARFGNFQNTKNYIALVGPATEGFEEKCGYYGQKVVLLAQTLGLNTCWVGMSYSKKKNIITVEDDDKLNLVIALGYGENQGKASSSKPMSALCRNDGEGSLPSWFIAAMEAAMLAPTAINHQKFLMTLQGNKVKAEALRGSYARVDLGIVKCNFEIGAEAAGATVGSDWFWA